MTHVELESRDGIGVVTLARPPANAIELELACDLLDVLARATKAPEIRGVVLTGQGRCFSAGVDTKVVPAYDEDAQRRMILSIDRVVHAIYGLPKPVVAAVNGHALGGGLVMAVAADLRVVTTADCKLGLTEVTAGISFPAAPMVALRAELPPATARTLTLTGRVFGASEARDLGIADELVAPDELVDRACALAGSLAEASAYAAVKRQLRRAAIAEMARIVEEEDDPLIGNWSLKGAAT